MRTLTAQLLLAYDVALVSKLMTWSGSVETYADSSTYLCLGSW